ncbi:MAG: aminopeptidase N [Pauljensenia sp.]
MYSLTRADAAMRSSVVVPDSIAVHLDLSAAGDPDALTFPVTSILGLTLSGPKTFLDVIGSVEKVLVDGVQQRVEHDGARLWLRELPVGQPVEIEVRAHCEYSRTGEGLHRYVDPEDARTYLYTQFEPADARRAWPCFDQPDLKARWTFHVTAPEGWVVASNGAEVTGPDDVRDGSTGEIAAPHQGDPTGDAASWRRVGSTYPPSSEDGRATGVPATDGPVVPTRVRTHHFAPTPPLSSYITAVVAGEWAVVEGGTWSGGATGPGADGVHVDVPLRLMCRRALAPHMDSEDVLAVTRAGLDFYHRHYGTTYPWGTYDQVFVPEYNLGAMENPGCVTFNEHYLSRDVPTFAQRQDRANTILHEMCHMWFGDLVTPAWWGDLWLKESFADHQGTLAAATATPYTGEWAAFAVGRKAWAYEQDQYPTTHPIAADVPDLDAAKNNFDGITYAKGAAVLKQLVAWVGEDAFFAGAREYFRDHAFSVATLGDLLAALSSASGLDLSSWERLWLRSTGPSVLAALTEADEGGSVDSFRLVQSPAVGAEDVLRPHSLVVSTWALRDGTLRRTHRFPVRTETRSTPIDPDGVLARPGAFDDLDLVVVNDEDLTYAVARLDERSTATALASIGTCPDPLTRAVVWAGLWNAVRDGLLRPAELARSVLSQAPSETADAVAERLLAMAGAALGTYTRGARRAELRRVVTSTARDLLAGAGLPADRARAWARFLVLTATGAPDLARSDLKVLECIAEADLPGLTVGPELSWSARTALASTGRAGRDRLDSWLEDAPTGEARTWHARSVAALPEAASRAAAWERVLSGELSNEALSATLWGLTHSSWEGTELDGAFFAEVLGFWTSHSIGMGIRFVRGAFPVRPDIDAPARSTQLRMRAAGWLQENDTAPEALRRLMVEHLDDLDRALRVQEAWT